MVGLKISVGNSSQWISSSWLSFFLSDKCGRNQGRKSVFQALIWQHLSAVYLLMSILNAELCKSTHFLLKKIMRFKSRVIVSLASSSFSVWLLVWFFLLFVFLSFFLVALVISFLFCSASKHHHWVSLLQMVLLHKHNMLVLVYDIDPQAMHCWELMKSVGNMLW